MEIWRVGGLEGWRFAGWRVGGLRVGGLRVEGLRVGGLRVGGLRVGGLRVGGWRYGGLEGWRVGIYSLHSLFPLAFIYSVPCCVLILPPPG